MRIAVSIMCSVVFWAGAHLAAQDCQAARNEYQAKNRGLIPSGTASQSALRPAQEQRMTDDLHEYLKGRILALLNAKPNTHAADIRKYIECLQDSPEYRDAQYMTNLPAAWETQGNPQSMLVGFWIYRGYAAVPNIRPYLEVYKKAGQQWTADGEVGSDFSGFTLSVEPISAGKPGEMWFLVSGSRIGQQPRSEQRMVVAAYDGASIKEIWERSGVGAMSLEGKFSDHIVLTGEVNNEQGRAEEIRERFDIVPDGLKLRNREVIKSY